MTGSKNKTIFCPQSLQIAGCMANNISQRLNPSPGEQHKKAAPGPKKNSRPQLDSTYLKNVFENTNHHPPVKPDFCFAEVFN